MLNFFKKKKKPEQPRSSYAIQGDEEIAYEIAKDYIRSIEGILSGYTYWLKEIGKDQSEAEKAHIAWVKARRRELAEEGQNLGIRGNLNEIKNNKIIDVYAALSREYHEFLKSLSIKEGLDREVAVVGLPEKFVTTKVDYSEFEEMKKGADNGMA